MTSAKKSMTSAKKSTGKATRGRGSGKAPQTRRQRRAAPIDPRRLLDHSGVPDPHPATELAAARAAAPGRARGITPDPPPGAFRDKKLLMRQSAVAPRAEPSSRGAKHWTSGRRGAKKYR